MFHRPGSARRQRGAHGHTGEARRPGLLSRARAPRAHVALVFPALPTILYTAQIFKPAHRLRTPPDPEFCQVHKIWGLTKRARRPGRPPVDKASSPRSWRGSTRAQHPPCPRPSGLPDKPSPARGEYPCWQQGLRPELVEGRPE